MKRHFKFSALLIASLGCIAAGAMSACKDKETSSDKTEYLWQYNKPFSATPDAFMTMDGKLDEEIWKNQTYYEYSNGNCSYRVTTVMTSSGIYIGGEAKDDFVYWELRNIFDSSSNFFFQLVRADEVGTTGLHSTDRLTRMATFNIDPYTCRSYKETPFLSAAYVESEDGSYNTPSHKVETTGFSVEIFVSWDDLNIEPEERNEKGYTNMKMVCGYRKQYRDRNLGAAYYQPFNMQDARYDTYYEVDESGFVGLNFGETSPFGHALNGVAATDKWIIDETAKTATVEVNRTQYIFPAKVDAATNYSIEAKVSINDLTNSSGQNISSGFITFMQKGGFSHRDGKTAHKIYSANLSNLATNKSLFLSVSMLSDGLQYIDTNTNDIWATRAETVLANNEYDATSYEGLNLQDGEIRLKLVKRGNVFFYFYNDILWEIEQTVGGEGKAHTGLFTNGAATFSDVKVEIYDGKEAELDTLIRQIAYQVDVPGVVDGGTFDTNSIWVVAQKSVDFTISADLGYYLSKVEEIAADGTATDITEQVKNGLVGTKYSYTPTRSVAIEAEFTRFATGLVDIPMQITGINDAGQTELLPGAEYIITDDAGKLYYTGTTNATAVIIGQLPVQGYYDGVGDLTGDYHLTVKTDGYYNVEEDFSAEDVNDHYINSGKKNFVKYETKTLPYGNVSLNGLTTNASGTLSYDEEASSYWSDDKGLFYLDETGGGCEQYYKDSVASDFVIDARFTATGYSMTTGHVPGIVITPGNSGYVLRLKRAPWEPENLVIDCGDDKDLSLSGFPADETSTQFVSTFSVVCTERAIYVFNKDQELRLVVDENGLHACGGSTFASESRAETMSKQVAKLFASQYKEWAFGFVNTNYGGTVYYDVNYKTGEAAKSEAATRLSGCFFNQEFAVEGYDVVAEGLRTSVGYVLGAPISLTLSKTSALYPASVLTIVDGTGENDVVGIYDRDREVTVFTLNGRPLDELTVKKYYEMTNISGSVSGVSSAGTVFGENCETEEVFEATLNENGSFVLKDVPVGIYDFEFISDKKVGYLLDEEITKTDNTVSGSVEENLYRITDSITLNGNTISATNQNGDEMEATTVEQRANWSQAATTPVVIDVANRYFANLVSNGDDAYIFDLTMSGNHLAVAGGDFNRYDEFGVGFTDGAETLMFVVQENYYCGPSTVYIRHKAVNGKVDSTANVKIETVGGFTWDTDEWTTLRIVKTRDSIAILRCGTTNNDFQTVCTLKANGTIESQGAFNGQDNPNFPWDASKTATLIRNLFDSTKKHTIMYASNNFSAFATLKASPKYEAVKLCTVDGTVSGVSIVGTVVAQAADGTIVTGALNGDGSYSMELPAGEYDFEFIAGDKVAYVLNQTITDSANVVDATAIDGTYRIDAETFTISGHTGTTTVEQRAEYVKANGNGFTIPVYNTTLANTEVNGKASYEFTMSIRGDSVVNGDTGIQSGIAIVNSAGYKLLIDAANFSGLYPTSMWIALYDSNGTGNNVALATLTYGAFTNGGGTDTYRVVKTAAELTIYRKSENNAEEVICQFKSDGTITITGTEKTDAADVVKTFVASLFDENTTHKLAYSSGTPGTAPGMNATITSTYELK